MRYIFTIFDNEKRYGIIVSEQLSNDGIKELEKRQKQKEKARKEYEEIEK